MDLTEIQQLARQLDDVANAATTRELKDRDSDPAGTIRRRLLAMLASDDEAFPGLVEEPMTGEATAIRLALRAIAIELARMGSAVIKLQQQEKASTINLASLDGLVSGFLGLGDDVNRGAAGLDAVRDVARGRSAEARAAFTVGGAA